MKRKDAKEAKAAERQEKECLSAALAILGDFALKDVDVATHAAPTVLGKAETRVRA
jgi:hypothetical protein